MSIHNYKNLISPDDSERVNAWINEYTQYINDNLNEFYYIAIEQKLNNNDIYIKYNKYLSNKNKFIIKCLGTYKISNDVKKHLIDKYKLYIEDITFITENDDIDDFLYLIIIF